MTTTSQAVLAAQRQKLPLILVLKRKLKSLLVECRYSVSILSLIMRVQHHIQYKVLEKLKRDGPLYFEKILIFKKNYLELFGNQR